MSKGGYDPIVSVRWKDAHQTMAVIRTESGKEHVLPNRHLPRGVVADACYTPMSGRYATKDHDAAVIETLEAGSVVVTPQQNPALWELAHATIDLAPYDEAPSQEQLPQPDEAEQIGEQLTITPTEPMGEIPLPAPTQVRPRGWSVSSLLARAATAEAEEKQPPPQQEEPAPPLFSEPPANGNTEGMPEGMDDGERLETAVSLAMTLDDGARRRMAQEKLSKHVDDWMVKTFASRSRYELAVQALNDLPFALEVFEPEAKERGITIQELCRNEVIVHQAAQRRMGHVYTIKAKALTDINAATGDDIDAIAGTAAAAIMGE